jgi:hypothetical protein
MFKNILLAAVLAFSATAASAGTVKLPEDYVGTWCVEYKDDELISLQRDNCSPLAEKTIIGRDTIDGYGGHCKLVKGRRSETGNAYTFVMFYRCGLVGEPRHDWRVNIVMKHGDLFLNFKRSGK